MSVSIVVKCVGCNNKKEYKDEEVPHQQPFCEYCGSPMIAERVELDTRKEKPPKKATKTVELEHMEMEAQKIGRLIGETLKEKYDGKVHFCLILASNEAGWFTYVSNVERNSMIELLKETIEKISKDVA